MGRKEDNSSFVACCAFPRNAVSDGTPYKVHAAVLRSCLKRFFGQAKLATLTKVKKRSHQHHLCAYYREYSKYHAGKVALL